MQQENTIFLLETKVNDEELVYRNFIKLYLCYLHNKLTIFLLLTPLDLCIKPRYKKNLKASISPMSIKL